MSDQPNPGRPRGRIGRDSHAPAPRPLPPDARASTNPAHHAQTTQRAHAETADPLRDPFELDRRRIVESTAFRRLEGKTQVFAPQHHDHFRTRMTHTLEVAQVARLLARHLGVNHTLTEAMALAHDLGHPPFGHAGERALQEAMAAHGGFNHNLHSLRVVEYLEHPFPAFRGLNLTAATRDGLVAHQTRYDVPGQTQPAAGEHTILPSIEAQIASAADRIAYDCHDLEDAIGAGFVGLHELSRVELWRDAYQRVAAPYQDRPIHALRRPVLNALMDALLTDLLSTARTQAAGTRGVAGEPRPSDASLRTSNFDLRISHSPRANATLEALEQFLMDHVYTHPEVQASDSRGRQVVFALFQAYRTDPGRLPPRYASRIDEQGIERVICDYIAGMTDRFCLEEHDRLTSA